MLQFSFGDGRNFLYTWLIVCLHIFVAAILKTRTYLFKKFKTICICFVGAEQRLHSIVGVSSIPMYLLSLALNQFTFDVPLMYFTFPQWRVYNSYVQLPVVHDIIS